MNRNGALARIALYLSPLVVIAAKNHPLLVYIFGITIVFQFLMVIVIWRERRRRDA